MTKATNWTYTLQGPLRDWPSVIDENGRLIARAYGPDAAGVARKMAAADDMLAALKALLVECEKIETARCQSFSACDDARAAIDKATG